MCVSNVCERDVYYIVYDRSSVPGSIVNTMPSRSTRVHRNDFNPALVERSSPPLNTSDK
jgi:hypothetical protein